MNNIQTSQASDLYAAWREASNARLDFYSAHEKAWTEALNAQYNELRNCSDRLWIEYLAASSGRTPEQVAASINDAIHSARD